MTDQIISSELKPPRLLIRVLSPGEPIKVFEYRPRGAVLRKIYCWQRLVLHALSRRFGARAFLRAPDCPAHVLIDSNTLHGDAFVERRAKHGTLPVLAARGVDVELIPEGGSEHNQESFARQLNAYLAAIGAPHP